MSFQLDYDQLILLDAEDLAEGGIRTAYLELVPALEGYVTSPAVVDETNDTSIGRYVVRCGDFEFVIYEPGMEENSWGRATFAFFKIVNDQMMGSEYRFYAINGGNDLGGMFLKPADVEAARLALPRKNDWPYIPTPDPPEYGWPG